MSKRTPRENLKSYSWIYIIVVAFFLVGTLICNLMPELSKPLAEAFTREGLNGMLIFNITAAIVCLIYLWYFWLARRVADGKSEGTLYMILLLLGVIGSLVTFFTTKGAGKALSFDAIIDLCGLYFLMQIKKGEK
ncbi:MAG: hypothetical protein IKF38_05575 [Clostridia bacterium]|nr:hypothetical protein [Clostridia bacterium]